MGISFRFMQRIVKQKPQFKAWIGENPFHSMFLCNLNRFSNFIGTIGITVKDQIILVEVAVLFRFFLELSR